MKNKFDVVVVGAGPSGAYTAYLLADMGFTVGLVDQNRTVAEDVLCTGIIGREAFERFDLPKDSILKAVRSIIFISPSNQRLEYDHADDLAYVVDRERFDAGLLEQARQRGVEVRFNRRVVAVKNEKSGVRCTVENGGGEYSTRVMVIATGVNYQLQSVLGMGAPPGYLTGVQTEVGVKRVNSAIEIYTGQNIAPGSFGWVVPLGNGTSRVGILSHKTNGQHTPRAHLVRLMEERLKGRIDSRNPAAIRQKPIAYGPIPRSVADKVVAVGEAAGQIKTTTGGGIFYGLVGAELAANAITNAIYDGTLNSEGLMEYERGWRKLLDSEFQAGYRIREIAEQLGDKGLDRCFSIMKRNRILVRLIKRQINFEYHSGLLAFCMKAFSSVLK